MLVGTGTAGLFLIIWMAVAVPGLVTACDPCESPLLATAAQTETGADDTGGGINPGIFVLAAVLVSIVVATIMVLRQSKPELPPDDEDRE